MVASSVAILALGLVMFHPLGRLVAFTIAYAGLAGTSYYQIKVFVPREHPDLPLPACLRGFIGQPSAADKVAPAAPQRAVQMSTGQGFSQSPIFATLEEPLEIQNIAVSIYAIRWFIQEYNVNRALTTAQVTYQIIKPMCEGTLDRPPVAFAELMQSLVGQWRALLGCYDQHRRPVARSS